MEAFWLRWLHVVAAMLWVGGSLFLPLVITPVFRHRFAPEQRTELVSAIGMRFRPIAWIALAVLVLTGIRQASIILAAAPDPARAFATTAYGRTLQVKIFLVAVILGLQALHDFYLGPKLRKRTAEHGPGLARARSATIGLAVGGLLLTLVVVTLAVALRFRVHTLFQ